MRPRVIVTILTLVCAGAVHVFGADAASAAPGLLGDFNADGYDDLAIGVLGEDLGSRGDAGAVNVIYGSANGLTSSGNQMWTQDSTGVQGNAEAGDQFGAAIAVGDFNDDGFDDLAVGVPGESYSGKNQAGAVNVLYGSQSGLRSSGNQLWTQDSAGIAGGGESDDRFGSTLAAGDFDNDLVLDLAVASPSENIGSRSNAGAVNVIYGVTGQGLRATGNQVWHQDSSGIAGSAEAEDRFGRALAVGDFDNQEGDDLAIGIPFEDLGATGDAGAVAVLYSEPSGLVSTANQLFTQDGGTIADSAEANDQFGLALAAADVNDDSNDDLIIGAPGEDVTVSDAGALHVVLGSAVAGLVDAGNQFWHQDVTDAEDSNEAGDSFGTALAGGDIDDDNFGDVVVGIPGEDVGSVSNAGAAQVFYGGASGLQASDDQVLSQDTAGVQGASETDDQLGIVVRTGDLDNAAGLDVVIAAPLEDVGSRANAGAVNVLYTQTTTGVVTSGNEQWTQDAPNIAGGSETDDRFGSA